jgi:hypothetical protein
MKGTKKRRVKKKDMLNVALSYTKMLTKSGFKDRVSKKLVMST